MTEDNGTVLVVDDDPQALALMIQTLEAAGYYVQPADSGKLALLSVASDSPDLIILDVKMPEFDGFEVCRRLKASEWGKHVPVMFISASRDKEEWVTGLSLGAVDFVSKPCQREELLARVKTHVELGRLQVQLEARVAHRTAELRDAVEQLRLEAAERRRAEQALRESELRFRQISNAAPVKIWTSNSDDVVDFRNEYAQAFTGRTMENLLGDGWSELVHPDDRERQKRESREGIASRKRFELEYRLRRADGEYRSMLDRAAPRFLNDGEFAGFAGIVIDLTDVQRAHEQSLHEKNLENLRVLSAGIAHDFNTMVGAIFGEVDLALSDMLPDSPGHESVERIFSVAKRAADVVRLLLAYVGDPIDGAFPEPVNLTALIEEIVPHLKPSILRKCRIRTSLASGLPPVRGNLLQMRMVVLNLILNAVEALGGEPGLVTVATGFAEIRAGCVDGAPQKLPDGRYVKLQVSDTGRGIAEEVQSHMFDPYYSTKSIGRGLGLAAVQGIMRSHGGAIHTKSVLGEGSMFEVFLPVAESIEGSA